MGTVLEEPSAGEFPEEPHPDTLGRVPCASVGLPISTTHLSKVFTLAFPRKLGYHSLALVKDDTVKMLFVFPYTLLVYAFHGWRSVSVSFFKSKLVLDICNISVPEKLNSVLESTAFR